MTSFMIVHFVLLNFFICVLTGENGCDDDDDYYWQGDSDGSNVF